LIARPARDARGARRRSPPLDAPSRDARARARAMASKISHIPAVVSSPALIAALLSFSIAQIAKVFTHYHATGKVDYSRIVGSGGMPSSHTALVVGLCTSIGLKEGMQSSIFALCLVFSLVVMYDATGVRLHAGRQAEVLNQLIVELPRDHPLTDSRPLRDTLGHTPIQVVVGAILGMSVAYAHFVYWMSTYSL
jgi:acid phosphatase family membrane protein YuiD